MEYYFEFYCFCFVLIKAICYFGKKESQHNWWVERKVISDIFSIQLQQHGLYDFTLHFVFSSLSRAIGFITVRTEMAYVKASICQHEWWGSCFLLAAWKLTFYYLHDNKLGLFIHFRVCFSHTFHFYLYLILIMSLKIKNSLSFRCSKYVILKSETCWIKPLHSISPEVL